MKTFKLTIVTPDCEKFSGEAESLTVRTSLGDVQIMAGHADYLASLGIGKAKVIFSSGEEKNASASGGFLSVKNGEVTLVTTTFEFAEEVDVKRAAAAKEKAEIALAAAKTEKETHIAKAKLARALARLAASGKTDY